MTKYVTEVLKEINDDPSLLHTTYKKHGDGGPLGLIFKHAFTAEGKFILPNDEPPFRKATEPMGVTPAQFIGETRKFYIFCRADLKSIKREQLFIQMLESIHPDEAKILLAIKDQKLTKLYPNITKKVVAEAGYIPQLTAEELAKEKETVKKSARPRGGSRKSASPQPVQSESTNEQIG
jgi:hypothetical protein